MSKGQDYYASLASSLKEAALVSGRYPIQLESERWVLDDVTEKLALLPTHSLLEIGCGAGNLLIPLSFKVSNSVGVDHAIVIERFKARFQTENIALIDGDFLDVDLGHTFDRVLIYSVLHCLDTDDHLFQFLDHALTCLAANGRMLIGDVPNQDRKQRFLASKRGRRFQLEWEQKVAEMSTGFVPHPPFKGVSIGDDTILRILSHLRSTGCHAYLVEQPAKLPFGNTREDILVVGPEYDAT